MLNINNWNVLFYNVYKHLNTILACQYMCRKVKFFEDNSNEITFDIWVKRKSIRMHVANQVNRIRKIFSFIIQLSIRWLNSIVRAWPWFMIRRFSSKKRTNERERERKQQVSDFHWIFFSVFNRREVNQTDWMQGYEYTLYIRIDISAFVCPWEIRYWKLNLISFRRICEKT